MKKAVSNDNPITKVAKAVSLNEAITLSIKSETSPGYEGAFTQAVAARLTDAIAHNMVIGITLDKVNKLECDGTPYDSKTKGHVIPHYKGASALLCKAVQAGDFIEIHGGSKSGKGWSKLHLPGYIARVKVDSSKSWY